MSKHPIAAGLACACMVLSLAACTEAGGAPVAPAALSGPAEVLSVRTADGTLTLDVRTGRVLLRAPGSAPQADW